VSQFVAVGTVLIMVILATMLAIWSIVDELRKLQRPRRARTCGTCKYCEGICVRHTYPVRELVAGDEDDRILRPTIRQVVRLEWEGCGESEERGRRETSTSPRWTTRRR
jgi:hypothetical protein